MAISVSCAPKIGVAAVAAAAFAGILASSPLMAASAPAIRAPDAFYRPPARRPARPDALLRSQPLKGASLPAGTRGWRILYTTSVNDLTPATAVATVVAPAAGRASPHPVLIWNHGTKGLLQKCMPSLASAPLTGAPALAGVAERGWVVVATDYSFAENGGPHPYLIGKGEARAALDAMRAAR